MGDSHSKRIAVLLSFVKSAETFEWGCLRAQGDSLERTWKSGFKRKKLFQKRIAFKVRYDKDFIFQVLLTGRNTIESVMHHLQDLGDFV
ncbi:hypothetical protein CEXT_22281 [Caerostris extrusa]|uniref:Uncharacterized protein n=1 Tax=Caerostris extrusa TaxID=172846 RepID=A0AAV4TK01_CAEEX|nr:hypothetical protein CEXT_22281 [Caerostris extrusa]